MKFKKNQLAFLAFDSDGYQCYLPLKILGGVESAEGIRYIVLREGDEDPFELNEDQLYSLDDLREQDYDF